jgi:hypothetical protein
VPLTTRTLCPASSAALPTSSLFNGRSDGLMDLLVQIAETPTTKNHVLRNTGGGVFEDLTAVGNQVYSAGAAGKAIWCDVSSRFT